MRKINEIFYSLQGEGHHMGYPSVFIRFAGCNLSCSFCDTDHEDGIMMSDDDIIHAVKLYRADWIVLTGGEPALFIDEDFIRALKRTTGKRVAIETNGTIPLPAGIDWVTVSPKYLAPQRHEEHADRPIVVEHADEIKVVDTGQELESYFHLPCRGKTTLMYLQPLYTPEEKAFSANRLQTVRRVLADPRWTLSVQLHRYLGIP